MRLAIPVASPPELPAYHVFQSAVRRLTGRHGENEKDLVHDLYCLCLERYAGTGIDRALVTYRLRWHALQILRRRRHKFERAIETGGLREVDWTQYHKGDLSSDSADLLCDLSRAFSEHLSVRQRAVVCALVSEDEPWQAVKTSRASFYREARAAKDVLALAI